ncbi:MAG: hypothetical protein PVJ67_01205 [Candidatus Pacearchaeota archaeon]|jgi:hypothetical protein
MKTNKPLVKRVELVTIEGHDEISDVLYREENATYRLYDNLTKPMTLPELSKYSAKEKEKGNPYVPNSEELWSVFTAIANSENPELISRVRDELRGKWIRTLTAIDWYSNRNSRVIHNVKTPDAYFKQRKVLGEDGFIHQVKSKKLLENVLGTNNVKKINSVSQKINQTPMYQWRINSKPDKKLRTSVELYAGSGRLFLDCGGDPLDECPAFRVLRVD